MLKEIEWYARALAQLAEIQISLFPDTGWAGDEMVIGWEEALGFLGAEGFIGQYSGVFNENQALALKNLDNYISKLSDLKNEKLWKTSGVYRNEWLCMRRLAKIFLDSMEWSISSPEKEVVTIIQVNSGVLR